jgi:membrane associated rhomboid family serine protease
VAANVAVFVLMLGAGAGFLTPKAGVHLAWGANFGPATKDGEWWRLFTAMFLHFGVIHLAFNMWALADAGRLVERLYGGAAFLAAYLFAGLTGSFASLLWNADTVVSAGASGAVFGVYGALFAFLLVQRGSVPMTALKRLAASGAMFVGYTLIAGAIYPGIDNACHVGGLLGGFAAGLALSRPLERVSGAAGRVAVAAAAGTAILAVLWLATPPAKYSYRAQLAAQRAINDFARTEVGLSARGRSFFKAWRRGDLDNAQAAERVERELVLPWDAAQKQLAAIALPPAAPAERPLELLKRYAAARHDMYALFAAGLRDGDRAKLSQADERAKQVKRLLGELKALQQARK